MLVEFNQATITNSIVSFCLGEDKANAEESSRIQEAVKETFTKAKENSAREDKINKALSVIYEDVATYNSWLQDIYPEALKNPKNHISRTQDFILKGSDHLNPDSSTVVVCGAQFYGNKLIEPLNELISKCKKLILVDYDEGILQKVKSLIQDSSKVTTIKLDLTGGLIRELARIEVEARKQKYSEYRFYLEILALYCNYINSTAEYIPAKDIFGEDGIKADYVVNSLVTSELSCGIRRELQNIIERLYHKTFEEFVYNLNDLCQNLLGKAMVKFGHMMSINTIVNLAMWTGPKGKIYYADTVKMIDSSNPFMRNKNTVLPETVNAITTISKKPEQRRWIWQQRSTSYEVFAAILGNLKPMKF